MKVTKNRKLLIYSYILIFCRVLFCELEERHKVCWVCYRERPFFRFILPCSFAELFHVFFQLKKTSPIDSYLHFRGIQKYQPVTKNTLHTQLILGICSCTLLKATVNTNSYDVTNILDEPKIKNATTQTCPLFSASILDISVWITALCTMTTTWEAVLKMTIRFVKFIVSFTS